MISSKLIKKAFYLNKFEPDFKSILKNYGGEKVFQPWFKRIQRNKEFEIIKTEEVKKDFYNLDELCKECPFDNFNIFENYNYADLVKHIKSEKCISTRAKDLRILSRVADLLVLKEGYIFIND